MRAAPDLTTIIVTYKNDASLARCLASLREAADELAHEVVVVDNGLQPSTARMVKQDFPEAEYVSMGSNVGFAAACNAAARRVRSKYLLFLNPDTIVPRAG